MRNLLAIIACALLSAVAFGATSPATSTAYKPVFPVTTSGNRTTFGAGTVTKYNVDTLPIVADVNGMTTSQAYKYAKDNGMSVPMNVAGNFGRASAAAAIGRFAAKGLPILGTGIALYDLAKELGFDARNKPDGSAAFSKHLKDYHCDVNYTPPADHDGMVFTYFCLPDSPGSTNYAYGFSVRWDQAGLPGTTWPCGNMTCPVGLNYNGIGYSTGSVSERDQEVTNQEFVDAIAAKSGWPSSTAVARTLRDAINSGEEVEVTPTGVTGPSTVSGPSKTTADPANHKTTTTSTQSEFGYGPGPSFTDTGKETTTTTDTDTGTSTTTTTTTTPTAPDPTTDTKDPCTEHPDRFGCMPAGTPPSETLPNTTHNVTVTPVAFTSSSVCPQPATFQFLTQTYALSYQPLCDQLALLKFLFLAIAGVIAAYILADSFKV